MSNTVSSKEALFMLDEDMEQEMQSYKEEVTRVVIKHINSTPKLYEHVKSFKGIPNVTLEAICTEWADDHGDEFGDLLVTELESVDWDKVARTI